MAYDITSNGFVIFACNKYLTISMYTSRFVSNLTDMNVLHYYNYTKQRYTSNEIFKYFV